MKGTKNAVEALLIVWPKGIPVAEYERAVALMEKAQGWSAEETKAAPALTPGLREKSLPSNIIGEPGLKKVRAALSTGPATAKEVVEFTGLSEGAVWAGLKRIAVHVGNRQRKDGFGTPAKVFALKPDAA